MHPVNRILASFGLNLRRVSDTEGKNGSAGATDVLTRVGGIEIGIPRTNPLYFTYRENPDFMGELSRIAREVFVKYPEMIAVDVGANVGDTAAIIRSGCVAPIICIDGDKTHRGVLENNASRIGGVTLLHAFLSDIAETKDMFIDKEGWNGTLVLERAEKKNTRIDFVTLDNAIQDVDQRKVKLLKIDTEGFDSKVLRGSRNILKTGHPVVIFEHNRENLSAIGEDNLSAFVQLKNAGYDVVMIWDAYGRLMVGTRLEQMQIIEDLHGYVAFDKVLLGKARYLDVCVFHQEDGDIAEKCLKRERMVRG
jgi:FkbM family methyltransferase